MATANQAQIDAFNRAVASRNFTTAASLGRALGFSDSEIATYVASQYPDNPNSYKEVSDYLAANKPTGGMLSGDTSNASMAQRAMARLFAQADSGPAYDEALRKVLSGELKGNLVKGGLTQLGNDILSVGSMGLINREGEVSDTAVRNLDYANKAGGVIMAAAVASPAIAASINTMFGSSAAAAAASEAHAAALMTGATEAEAVAAASAASTAAGGSAVTATEIAAINSASTGLASAAATAGMTPAAYAATTAGINLLGGYLNNKAASDAAETQADAVKAAAEAAAEAAKLKGIPYGTAFSQFKPKVDEKGNLIGVENTLDPTFQAQQDRLKMYSNIGLDQIAQGANDSAPMRAGATGMMTRGNDAMRLGDEIFKQAPMYATDPAVAKYMADRTVADSQRVAQLGGGYLTGSPQDQAAKYMADQQALLAPQRATDLANLQANLQATGRAGLAVGGDAGMMAANPQMQAYYNSLRQQDLGLAAQATQGGMDYAKFGTGLLGSASDLQGQAYQTQALSLDPYKQALGIGMETTKYGAGMLGSGGDMLKNMYSTQNAAFTPYGTVMSGMQNIEGLRQNALDIGVGLGSKETAARAQGGQMLANGMTNAANIIGQQQMQAGSEWGNLLRGASGALSQYQTNQNNQAMQQRYFDALAQGAK